MNTKICSKCKEEKDFSLFYYKNEKPGSWCKNCQNESNKRYIESKAGKNKQKENRNKLENKIKKSISDKLYRELHKEELKEKKKAYYEANKEKRAKKSAENYALNPEKTKERKKNWVQNNRDKHNKSCLERHAIKIQAKPNWFDEFDELVFLEASNLALLRKDATGYEWEVDHIIPLQGKEVQGLHVWNNVQVIPQSLNASKRNRYTGEPEQYALGLFRL